MKICKENLVIAVSLVCAISFWVSPSKAQDVITKIDPGPISNINALQYICAFFANENAPYWYADAQILPSSVVEEYIASKLVNEGANVQPWVDISSYNDLVRDQLETTISGRYASAQDAVQGYYSACRSSVYAQIRVRWWNAEIERQRAARQ